MLTHDYCASSGTNCEIHPQLEDAYLAFSSYSAGDKVEWT
jgi:hypothetical protein